MTVETHEHELLRDLGPLLWDAIAAFGRDLTYFVDMSEAANLIEYKRQLWKARTEAVRRATHPDEVKGLTEIILTEWGVASR